MPKKGFVAVCVLIVMFLSACAMDEKLEEMNNRETLIVLKWQFGMPDSKVRHDVLDQELIQEMNEFFAQVDWQEGAEVDRPLPHFQIGNNEIWIMDESPIVHAVNLEEDTYAELTAEDSEFIIRFLIGIGMDH